jgi:hypothetical protein
MVTKKLDVTIKSNSLGIAQANIEAATKELKAAQSNYERAVERLQIAEETHNTTTVALVNEMNAVRGNAKVTPLALR